MTQNHFLQQAMATRSPGSCQRPAKAQPGQSHHQVLHEVLLGAGFLHPAGGQWNCFNMKMFTCFHSGCQLLVCEKLFTHRPLAWCKHLGTVRLLSFPRLCRILLSGDNCRAVRLIRLHLLNCLSSSPSFQEVIKVVQPVLLGQLILFFENYNPDDPKAFHVALGYAAGLSVCTIGLALLHHLYFYYVQRAGMKIRVAMCHMIYMKVSE